MSKKNILTVSLLMVACGAAILAAQPALEAPPVVPVKAQGDGAPPSPPPALTEQQESDFLTLMDTRRPEVAKQLRKLKEENPRAYRWALLEAWRSYQIVKDMPPDIQRAHDTLVRTRVVSWQTSRDLLAAKDAAEKDKLRARLTELLGAEFDCDQTIREYRLNQLEEQLKRLRAELKDRAANRDSVIERNLQDLVASKVRPKTEGEPRRGGPRPSSRPADKE